MSDLIDDQISLCIQKTRRNIAALEPEFPRFPAIAHSRGWNTSGDDEWNNLTDGYWTGGFWVGILFLCHSLTGDNYFLDNARRWLLKLAPRSGARLLHDVGFLFFPSSVLGHALTGEEDLKITSKRAAYTLLRLFDKDRGFIPILDSDKYRDVLAVDTMMNLPLLWWAASVADMPDAADTAHAHARMTARHLLRRDGSTAHIARLDARGELDRIESWQGLSPDSCWSRGHAWALAGAAHALFFTGDDLYERMLNHLLSYYRKMCPNGEAPPWDYNDPGSDVRDTSAAAAVAQALLLISTRPLNREYFDAALPIVERLAENHATGVEHPAFLKRVCFHKPAGQHVEASAIFADFYYLFALYLTTEQGRKDILKLAG